MQPRIPATQQPQIHVSQKLTRVLGLLDSKLEARKIKCDTTIMFSISSASSASATHLSWGTSRPSGM